MTPLQKMGVLRKIGMAALGLAGLAYSACAMPGSPIVDNPNQGEGGLEGCTVAPSCKGPVFELASTDCPVYDPTALFENSYTCSVKEEYQFPVRCPEGWRYHDFPDDVVLRASKFYCFKPCFNENLDSCPTPPSIPNPCPPEFIYSYPYETDPLNSSKVQYVCSVPERLLIKGNVCNQCGSRPFGGGGVGGTEKVYCITR